MSYDRVLPKPVALRYESVQVTPRPSNLLDHKIMNDLPNSMHEGRYDPRPVSQSHVTLNMPESKMGKPVGPMLTTKGLPMRERSERSSSSSASSNSPIKSKDSPVQFCLCQPEPKVPRPRNGESMWSAPSLHLGKCFFDCFFFGLHGQV
jgi:HMG box factor